MKKIIVLLLMCAISLSLAACGQKEALASAPVFSPIDLDLSEMSGTVVYSQVYDMVTNPDAYLGQRIRIKGTFSYFMDTSTGQEYFACLIADATACCAQGIEFVCADARQYPDDYPPIDTEITVTGTFAPYYEGDFMYMQLADAEISW